MNYTLAEFKSSIIFESELETVLSNLKASWILVTDITLESQAQKILQAVSARNAHRDSPPKCTISVLPNGEAAKTMASLEKILTEAFDAGLDRNSCFVAFGGGTVSDVVGFAASLYMRGCKFMCIPTTLLSMVDACFGGKTGINYRDHKNMLGAMYPASEIHISVPLLRTLSQQEFTNGLAEVIKSAMLGDSTLLEILETRHGEILQRNEEILFDIISRSLAVKANIVCNDFRESGLRSHLNLGHTFAHALEAVSKFGEWSHGRAVAWGLFRALRLGEKMGICDSAYRIRIERILNVYNFTLNAGSVSSHELYKAMLKDKKRTNERIRFILQRGVGETLVQEVDKDIVLSVLNEEY